MRLTYKLTLRAQKHFREATSWYFEQNSSVAEDFVIHVEEGLNAICKQVIVQRQQYKNFGHYFLKKYPYTIIYTVDESLKLVIIRAVYHQKRNPEKKYGEE